MLKWKAAASVDVTTHTKYPPAAGVMLAAAAATFTAAEQAAFNSVYV